MGAAWVFTRSGGVWSQQGQKLVGSGVRFAGQGLSVSLSADGNTALIGGPSIRGGAWIFRRAGTVWSQVGGELFDSAGIPNGDGHGASVSLSADGYTALVGGPFDNRGIGVAWVFSAPKSSVTSLTSSASSSIYGQAVTYTAGVTAGATGAIAFTIDGVREPPVTLNGSHEQFTILSGPVVSQNSYPSPFRSPEADRPHAQYSFSMATLPLVPQPLGAIKPVLPRLL
jgi:hypothetical protein